MFRTCWVCGGAGARTHGQPYGLADVCTAEREDQPTEEEEEEETQGPADGPTSM